MRVRFARWLSGGLIAAGLILLVTAVALLAGGSSEGGVHALVAGLVLALIGGVYLGPLAYVVIDDSSVRVPVMAGGQGRVEIRPNGRLRMEGDRLVVVRGGARQTVPAYRAMAHRPDWDRMASMVRDGRARRDTA